MKNDFHFIRQLDAMDCGPTCLQMVTKHYKRHINLETLRERCNITRTGVSCLVLVRLQKALVFVPWVLGLVLIDWNKR